MGQRVSERPASWALAMAGGEGEASLGVLRDLLLEQGRPLCKKGWSPGEMIFMELAGSWDVVGAECQAWVRVELTAMFTGS